MLIDAAADGQGVALARTALAGWVLINRRLARPFTTALPLSKTYWTACSNAASMFPKVAMFADWLLAEAADHVRLSRRSLHKRKALLHSGLRAPVSARLDLPGRKEDVV
jgi:hypothetical protein